MANICLNDIVVMAKDKDEFDRMMKIITDEDRLPLSSVEVYDTDIIDGIYRANVHGDTRWSSADLFDPEIKNGSDTFAWMCQNEFKTVTVEDVTEECGNCFMEHFIATPKLFAENGCEWYIMSFDRANDKLKDLKETVMTLGVEHRLYDALYAKRAYKKLSDILIRDGDIRFEMGGFDYDDTFNTYDELINNNIRTDKVCKIRIEGVEI